MIKIQVGSSPEKTFDVHRGLLCYHSDYFLACLNDDLPQDSASQFTLEDEDPTIFAIFFIWMYTSNLMDDNTGRAPEDLSWEVLVELYLFAHRRLARRFSDACIDALIMKMNATRELAPPALVERAWNNSVTPGDPIRRLFVEFSVQVPDVLGHLGIEGVEAYPKEFLAQVLHETGHRKTLEGQIGAENLRLWEFRCSFHTHVEGEDDCWTSYGL